MFNGQLNNIGIRNTKQSSTPFPQSNIDLKLTEYSGITNVKIRLNCLLPNIDCCCNNILESKKIYAFIEADKLNNKAMSIMIGIVLLPIR